jgi:ABC-type nitrate/sulfonate/bicarbonate transport system substrate-binding protein
MSLIPGTRPPSGLRMAPGRTPGAAWSWLAPVLAACMALAACAAPAAGPAAPSSAADSRSVAPAAGSPPSAGAVQPTAPQPIKVVLGTISASIAPVVVAQEAGFLARQGLDAELIAARVAREAMAAVVSQDVPIGAIGGNAVINASAGGGDLVMVAMQQLRFTYQVMASPELRSFADLRGKRLGIADVGGSSDLATQYALDKFGLRRNDDVNIVVLGGQGERLGGLQAGAVQASMLQAPFTAAARKSGYQAIFNYADEDYEVPVSTIVTSRAYLRSQPEVMRGFVTALVDAIQYFKTDREQTTAIMGRFLKEDDPEVLAELYREAAGPVMLDAPYPSVSAVANAIEQLVSHNPDVARLRADDLVDDRFVRELDQSGYIARLYGR